MLLCTYIQPLKSPILSLENMSSCNKKNSVPPDELIYHSDILTLGVPVILRKSTLPPQMLLCTSNYLHPTTKSPILSLENMFSCNKKNSVPPDELYVPQ